MIATTVCLLQVAVCDASARMESKVRDDSGF
jgi:hypothetical protein